MLRLLETATVGAMKYEWEESNGDRLKQGAERSSWKAVLLINLIGWPIASESSR